MVNKKRALRNIALVFVIIICISSLSACTNNDDVELTLFDTTLGELRSYLTKSTETDMPEFKTLKKDLDAYIYKCTINDRLYIIVYVNSTVNAFDVILNYNDSSNEDFVMYAQCVGALVSALDISVEIDTLITSLSLDDFSEGIEKTYQSNECYYEYNVSSKQIIFSMYKQ